LIEDDVWIDYGAIVLTGVAVIRGAIIAAGSVVTRDVPAYSIAAGVPPRLLGKGLAMLIRLQNMSRLFEKVLLFSLRRGTAIAPLTQVFTRTISE
jgi:serine acetyltransferase